MKLRWKKGLLSKKYTFFEGGKKIGELKGSTLTEQAKGRYKNKRFIFLTSGLFQQKTYILDKKTKKEIGTITYNPLRSRAELVIKNETYRWKFDNVWRTRWSMQSSQGKSAVFQGTTKSGKAKGEVIDGLILLSGLLVRNHFSHRVMA